LVIGTWPWTMNDALAIVHSIVHGPWAMCE
jgi:hypothetical protein